jgi:hypothetical protein
VDLGVRDQVVVVEDEHELPGEPGQVVKQQRQHDLDKVGARAAQCRQRTAPDLGLDASQRRDHVSEEARRIVVVLVE